MNLVGLTIKNLVIFMPDVYSLKTGINSTLNKIDFHSSRDILTQAVGT